MKGSNRVEFINDMLHILFVFYVVFVCIL